MAVIEANNNNFEEIVLKSEGKVLVDFNAEWCGPCKMLKPALTSIASENNSVKIVSVNVDEADELAMNYGVSSIPCLVLFENGQEINRSIGLIPKEAIEDMIGGAN